MTLDLHLPIEIVGVRTERDADGLALSSRNQYLSAAERMLAPEIHQTLRDVGEKLTAGRRDFVALESAAKKRLQDAGFKPQYVAIRTKALEAPEAQTKDFVVLAAAHLGSTRLIDNLQVHAV